MEGAEIEAILRRTNIRNRVAQFMGEAWEIMDERFGGAAPDDMTIDIFRETFGPGDPDVQAIEERARQLESDLVLNYGVSGNEVDEAFEKADEDLARMVALMPTDGRA